MLVERSLSQSGIISIHDLDKEGIERILEKATEMKKSPPGPILQGKILASCFFEPSTRTRLSFESAMLRLGGQVIGFADGNVSSAKKGESLQDSIRVVGGYSDVIVIRHPLEGSARLAADNTAVPVINAGDGANQHPTQTLVDLFSIQECQGKLDGLHIALAGDLKYSRTIHSLALAAGFFNMRLYFVGSEKLPLPEALCNSMRQKGMKFSFHRSIDDIIDKVDILYMTRLQKERFESCETGYQSCLLKEESLNKAKANLRIFHPLPRCDEMEQSIDTTPHAYYFEQAKNGLYVRMALLTLLLEKHDD